VTGYSSSTMRALRGGNALSNLVVARFTRRAEAMFSAAPRGGGGWKWRGVPVWSRAGMICTGERYKNVVKMTFVNGATFDDPSGFFNSSLQGNTRRAMDFHEGDEIDEKA